MLRYILTPWRYIAMFTTNFIFPFRSMADIVQRSQFSKMVDKSATEEYSARSIHADHILDVYEVPFDVLIRPFQAELEDDKVNSLMETLKDPKTRDLVTPVDVLWIKGREGGNYYYSFGGCHRYAAHKKLGLKTIRCKLVKSTVEDLWMYLGASTPDLK